jgi:capsid protein
MSRKKRYRAAAPSGVAAMEPVLQTSSAYLSGYAGANFSLDRAQMNWWNLESRLDLDSFSRWELVRRSRWLIANVGFVRGIIRNSAELVGCLTPQARTADPAWNRLAEQHFRDRCCTAAAFDRAGKFDFMSAQPMLMRKALTDGDILTVLLSAQNGAGRVAFIESPQVQSPGENDSGKWADGVLLDDSGRHLAYGIRNYSNDSTTVISSRDAIYFGEFDSPGHVRAIPKLAHAINHATDITEIRAFTKKAIKNASLLGTIREVEAGAQPAKSKQGLAGTLREVQTASGQKIEVMDVWGSGINPELPPGHKQKILHDERPHPNQQAFLEVLARDIAIGFGLPLEVVWQMTGLTGPGVRFVMDVASRWIGKRQQALEAWCRNVYVWTIAQEIKSGRLPMPKGDRGWWAVEFIPERDLTIDRGRDGRQALEEMDRGVATASDYSRSMSGKFWQDQFDQRIDEVAYAMARCEEKGIPYERAFPPRAGAAPITTDPTSPPADPTASAA